MRANETPGSIGSENVKPRIGGVAASAAFMVIAASDMLQNGTGTSSHAQASKALADLGDGGRKKSAV